jgi:hypothetical protein
MEILNGKCQHILDVLLFSLISSCELSLDKSLNGLLIGQYMCSYIDGFESLMLNI